MLVEYPNRVAAGLWQFHLDADHDFVVRDYRFANSTDQQRERLNAAQLPWLSWKPDGIISMVGCEMSNSALAWARETPLVNASSDCAGLIPTVRTSHGSVAKLADLHFESLGLTSVGYVGLKGIPAMVARGSAFFERIASRGGRVTSFYELEHNPTAGITEMESLASCEPGLLRFLAAAPKPLGILAGNDRIGRAVCLACETLGLSVPADVAVLGVGNTLTARSGTPALSSIHTPGEDVGQRAMELILRMIDGERFDRSTVIDIDAIRLVARDSTSIEPSDQRSVSKGEDDSTLEFARRLIRSHACDGRSVGQILRSMPVSRAKLERSFKRVVGWTLHEELQRVRIERAKELLRMTPLPVTQIARMVGYGNVSGLTHAFTRDVGVPPTQFRHRHRGNNASAVSV